MAKTIEDLRQSAIKIRDEKGVARNSAARLGQAFLDHVDKMDSLEKKMNEIISEGVIEGNVLGGGNADTKFDAVLGGLDASL